TVSVLLSIAAMGAASLFGLLVGAPVTAGAQTSTSSLRWTGCGNGGMQCARLSVPLDDTAPGSPMASLALARYPARDPEHRIGSLVMNPGGPGGSGIDYLPGFAQELPSVLRDRFDVVSFDPRGIGRSDPVDCHADLDAFFALEWVPTTPDQQA